MMNQTQVVADIEQGTVLATVEIAAAPERVFEALVSAKDVLKWWGSDESHRTTEWEADVRPGGKWRAVGRSKAGTDYTVEGEYIEVDPPRKLAFSWRPTWDAPNETRVTYMLEPMNQGTRLTLRHEGFGSRVPMVHAHGNGWQQVLRWLAGYIMADGPQPLYFLFKLLPPRPSFMQDMSADELSLMLAHGAYWRGHLAEGKVIAFGPVADPAGGYGMGIMRVTNPDEVSPLTEGDPVIVAGQGFKYEVFPMPRAVHI